MGWQQSFPFQSIAIRPRKKQFASFLLSKKKLIVYSKKKKKMFIDVFEHFQSIQIKKEKRKKLEARK